jgi:hypothetical protein
LKLFGELSTIYPIGRVVKDAGDRQSLRSSGGEGDGDKDACYAIRGVELPMVIDNRYSTRQLHRHMDAQRFTQTQSHIRIHTHTHRIHTHADTYTHR